MCALISMPVNGLENTPHYGPMLSLIHMGCLAKKPSAAGRLFCNHVMRNYCRSRVSDEQ
jgi:hypothetical protein